MARRSFESLADVVGDVPGWMTVDQARCLYDAASALAPESRVVEIGSHHGRSAIVLASALPSAGRLVAIDPFPEDWRYGAAGTEQACRTNLANAGVADLVDLRVTTSDAARAAWSGPLDLVYVDGKHDYWTVRADLCWASLITPGGWLLLHDAFSSLGVTTALLRELATSQTLRYEGRVGSLARLQVAPPSLGDRVRVLAELPWWGRNLVVKVLLRLRLRPLARLLRHHDVADPY